MAQNTLPLPDSTTAHVGIENGKPTKDFFNWLKSLHDFVNGLGKKGFVPAQYDAGTISSGTFTPDATKANYQYLTNNGAFTWAVPADHGGIDVLVTNGANAGAITFSGYTVAAGNTGDPLTTTNGNKFLISIRRINATSTYLVKALQ